MDFPPLRLPQTEFMALYSILQKNPQTIENAGFLVRHETAFYISEPIRIRVSPPKRKTRPRRVFLFASVAEAASTLQNGNARDGGAVPPLRFCLGKNARTAQERRRQARGRTAAGGPRWREAGALPGED